MAPLMRLLNRLSLINSWIALAAQGFGCWVPDMPASGTTLQAITDACSSLSKDCRWGWALDQESEHASRPWTLLCGRRSDALCDSLRLCFVCRTVGQSASLL